MQVTLDYRFLSFRPAMVARAYIEPEEKKLPKIHKKPTIIQRFLDWLTKLRVKRQLSKTNAIIENFLRNEQPYVVSNTESRKEVIEIHQYLKYAIDSIGTPPKSNEHTISTSINSSLAKKYFQFIDLSKQLEQRLRVILYPNENEILLTFDELKFLAEQQKDWDKD